MMCFTDTAYDCKVLLSYFPDRGKVDSNRESKWRRKESEELVDSEYPVCIDNIHLFLFSLLFPSLGHHTS